MMIPELPHITMELLDQAGVGAFARVLDSCGLTYEGVYLAGGIYGLKLAHGLTGRTVVTRDECNPSGLWMCVFTHPDQEDPVIDCKPDSLARAARLLTVRRGSFAAHMLPLAGLLADHGIAYEAYDADNTPALRVDVPADKGGGTFVATAGRVTWGDWFWDLSWSPDDPSNDPSYDPNAVTWHASNVSDTLAVIALTQPAEAREAFRMELHGVMGDLSRAGHGFYLRVVDGQPAVCIPRMSGDHLYGTAVIMPGEYAHFALRWFDNRPVTDGLEADTLCGETMTTPDAVRWAMCDYAN